MPANDEATRDLRGYVAIFKRRIWLTVLVLVVTVGVAAAYSLRLPTLYRAKMKIVVGAQGGVLPLNVGNVADQFTQTMSDLLSSDIVASRAIQDLQARRIVPGVTAQELLGHLSVVTKPNTAVLQVSYDDTVEGRGVQVLGAVGKAFSALVDERLAKPDEQQLTVSVAVFNPAHPTGKVQPKPVRNLALAFILGILLGLIAAVLREQFDDTLRSSEDAEAAFGQTATVTLAPGILGFRPFDRMQPKRADPVLAELTFQRVRASILWSPDSQESRTLLVTSGNSEEGKTTITANLAIIMATEGHNVVVVDGDLRHPTLYRYLGKPLPTDSPNLDNVMRGEIKAADALHEIPVPARTFAAMSGNGGSWVQMRPQPSAPGRLRAILAAPGPGRSSEFGLARTLEVITELRGLAEFVIFDGPPILIVPDAYPFAAAVDSVIAVVRNGRATGKDTTALSRTLERLRARRIELVLTDVESSYSRSSYYGSQAGISGERPGEERPGTVGSGPGAGLLAGRVGRPRQHGG